MIISEEKLIQIMKDSLQGLVNTLRDDLIAQVKQEVARSILVEARGLVYRELTSIVERVVKDNVSVSIVVKETCPPLGAKRCS